MDERANELGSTTSGTQPTMIMLRLWLNILLVANYMVPKLCVANPVQVPLEVQTTNKPRNLRGRFLHITDMHPDPHYLPNTAESTACHRKKKKKKKKNVAGHYGTPYSDCDSPLRLTNFTLDYLKENWANEIDFVIWTGDSARHDNDRKIPRTLAEIYDLNRAMASRMHKVFHSKGIPVVPTLGNNDVWPHNIMLPGPNSITIEYASIWNAFIPFPHLQVFHRGAYFATEVIPGQVAVISLNTMYFYDSNKVVSGCLYKNRNDPGNLQFDWLEVQLEKFRKAGLQVWIIGHVPPTPGNYFSECYVRYVELALRFQGTILGHLYGHMNADHFFFLEAEDLRIFPEEEEKESSVKDLFDSLLEDFGTLPKKANETDMDGYAVVNVAPSVVPNPFLPSFRIYSYNTTGEGGASEQEKRKHGHRRGGEGNKETCKRRKYSDTWRCHLNEGWNSDRESASRKNGRWTPLGYAQYYIPRLKRKRAPTFELEYVTYTKEGLVEMLPLKQVPDRKRWDEYVGYNMKDLTIGSWMGLGLAVKGEKRVRDKFRGYMMMR